MLVRLHCESLPVNPIQRDRSIPRDWTELGMASAVNMEPIYAILLAIVLLGEQRELGARFYAGGCIILGTVFAHPLLARRIAR